MASSKPVGKTKDVGFQVGVRKTIPITLQQAWDIISSEGIGIWLGDISFNQLKEGNVYKLANGCSGEIRVFSPLSHIRLTWKPEHWQRPSTIQVRVIANGDKTVIAFHQENLPGLKERQERRAFFKKVLEQIEEMVMKNIKNA